MHYFCFMILSTLNYLPGVATYNRLQSQRWHVLWPVVWLIFPQRFTLKKPLAGREPCDQRNQSEVVGDSSCLDLCNYPCGNINPDLLIVIKKRNFGYWSVASYAIAKENTVQCTCSAAINLCCLIRQFLRSSCVPRGLLRVFWYKWEPYMKTSVL
jgi:hypothetical protein